MIKTNNTEWRLTQLEKDQVNVSDKVDKIMTNHLPHLKEQLQGVDAKLSGKIEALKVRVNLGIGVNVLMFVTTVVGIILLIKNGL